MKYVVSSTLLYGRLQNVERVIQTKNSLAILSCFLFDVKGQLLEITSSDGETIMKTKVELSEASGDIKFAIDAKKLMDILREIPDQPLTFDVDPNTIQIELTYQNGSFSIQGEPGDDFPEQRLQAEEDNAIKLDAVAFCKGLGTAIVAAASNDGRKVMNGVYMDISPNDVSLVASDGHKLVRYSIATDTQDTTVGMTVPQKPAAVLKSALDKETGTITIHTYGTSSAVIETENYTISCRLIEERYPNYKSVIPEHNDNVAVIDRASLISAMRRVMVVSDPTTTLIKFQFEPNQVTLTTEDINYSQRANEKLVCQYDGMPLKIGFKGADLINLVNNIQTPDIILKLSDPSKAGLILPSEQEKGTDVVMLLMPLLING